MLDSKAPRAPLRELEESEARFSALARSHPREAEALLAQAQADVWRRWRQYEALAASAPGADEEVGS